VELSSRSPLIIGYRSLLQLAQLVHVNHLTIPVSLWANDSPMLSMDVQIKRAEVVLKQSKGIFTELSRNPRIEKIPRQIIYIITPHKEQTKIYEEVHDKLSNIFRTV
jgi:hypothetical protein